jgi:hypothetical protein
VGKPGHVVKNGIGGHLDDTFTIGPPQVLSGFMVKYIRDKHTFLTITERACNPAIITIDAIGKIGVQFV